LVLFWIKPKKDDGNNDLVVQLELTKYLRLDKARLVTAALFDHTNGAASGTSERLNGSANEKFGVARSITVAAGDVVSTEVYAKYVDPNSANWSGALTSLIGQIASGTVGVVVDGANYSNAVNPFPYPGTLAHTPSGTGPKAYLNWLVFDKNWTLDASKSGYMQMSTAGKEAGTDVAHERLFSPPINITEPGYVYIYLSNEETTPVDVFFDDLKVTQVKTPIVQVQDYYPFGLCYNSFSRGNSITNNYELFQGQEHIVDLNLNWDEFKWRNHQPEIGRFFGVDKLADKYYHNSPYAFSENHVTAHFELEGLEPLDFRSYMRVYRSENVQSQVRAANISGNKSFSFDVGLQATGAGVGIKAGPLQGSGGVALGQVKFDLTPSQTTVSGSGVALWGGIKAPGTDLSGGLKAFEGVITHDNITGKNTTSGNYLNGGYTAQFPTGNGLPDKVKLSYQNDGQTATVASDGELSLEVVAGQIYTKVSINVLEGMNFIQNTVQGIGNFITGVFDTMINPEQQLPKDAQEELEY
jgi:hypothetical protein